MQSSLFSVILPVYNQAEHIGKVVEEFVERLKEFKARVEFVLVVNACRDHSLSVCQELAKANEGIRVVHSEKGGWGLAVRLGLKEASGDFVCYTNSARTSPEELLRLLNYALANPNDIIKANRKIRMSIIRMIGSYLYNFECRLLFDLMVWDVNGTPKVFPRKYDKLMKLERDDDLIDLEFNAICRREDYPMLEIPIFFNQRYSGRSTTGLKSAVRMYWNAYSLWRAGKKAQN